MRKSGGYNTRQRTVVENILRNNRDVHMTAHDIELKLSQAGESIGKTTVYRTLKKLVSSGKVHKYTTEQNDGACFQYIEDTGECHEHFHLKCTACGELLHLDCQKVSELAGHISCHHGFTLNTGRTVLYGLCANCQAKG